MTDTKRLLILLADGIAKAQLKIENSVQVKLIEYIELLIKWNAVYNLTAIRDPEEMIIKHVLDSLVLLPYLGPGRIVDVGTGAGVPGIPLALCLPAQEFVLLDSSQKKITFVQHVILSLKLGNVRAICTRVEAYLPPEPFDWVLSRAFASLAEFIHLARHLCHKEGKLVAMKGAIGAAEIAEVSSESCIQNIQPVQVPGLEAARVLVFIAVDQKGKNSDL